MELAGMEVNPKSRVSSAAKIPMQPITPRAKRIGLMGRCSATGGRSINGLLFDPQPARQRKLSFRAENGIGFRRQGDFSDYVLWNPGRDGRSDFDGALLTRRVRASKLRHENEKRDLVSLRRPWHLHRCGRRANPITTR